MKVDINQKLDLREKLAPLMLLEISETFRELKKDDCFTFVASDPETINDIFKVLPKSSFDIESLEDVNSIYTISLKKNID